MTTYSTGNPIGSTDPKDLFDNAENFDNALNGGSDTWIDRLGNPRQSVKSFESRFLAALANVGLDFIGDYATGIQVTEYNQVIRSGGRFWRLSASENLPYTTTGSGMPEAGAFVDIGDGYLRQELVNPVATYNNVVEMQADTTLAVGRKCRTLGYYTSGDGGGNDYEIVSDGTGTADGGSIIDLFGSGLQARGLFDGLANVCQFGATGDCTGVSIGTDDTPFIQSAVNWFKSESNRELVFLPGKRFRMSSGVDCVFSNVGENSRFIMKSPVTPDPGVSRAFTIANTRDMVVEFYVLGGGQTADYTQEFPVGHNIAFYMRGTKGATISATGYAYKGRVLHLGTPEPGEVHTTSMINIKKLLTGNILPFSGDSCGQSLFVKTGSLAFGNIISAITFWDDYGPFFHRVTDITINHWESGWRGNSAMVFKGCVSVWCDTLALGDETQTFDLVTFIPDDDGRNCANIMISKFFGVGGRHALYAEDVGRTPTQQGIDVRCFTRNNSESAVKLVNCVTSDVFVSSFNDKRGLEIEGTVTSRCNYHVKSIGARREAILIDSFGDDIVLTGMARDANRDNETGTSLIKCNQAGSHCVFRDFFCSSDQVEYLYDLPAGNNVRILGGRLLRSGGISDFSRLPRRLRDCHGARSENRGSVTFPAGETSLVVNHSLISEPLIVLVSPRSSAAFASEITAINYTSTTFTLSLPSAAPSSFDVNWRAEIPNALG